MTLTPQAAAVNVEALSEPSANPFAELAPAPAIAKSLKRRAIDSSAWTVIGYVSTLALRLVSSIILSRLLAPEVFGLMTMVSIFLVGLEMFSDIGIHPSIIQNKRGDQASFLNTAWTMQVGRGFILWIASCIGAWPVALFFEEPVLVWVIPVVGLTAFMSGFDSTAVPWLNRRLDLGKITILGVVNQVFNYVIIVAWAWFSPTVWALVAGSIASTLTYTIATHFLVRGHRNRFEWNRDDARALFRFGRWIFFSTVLTFFAMQADKIMCGKLLGTHTLGVFGYALPIAMLAPQFIKQIGMQVAFPVLSEVARDDADTLDRKVRKVRMALIGVSMLVLVPLMLLGNWIVQLLYDERYSDAGWMVQILAGGALGGIVNSTYGSSLLAIGRSFDISCLLATHLVFLVGGGLLGYQLNDEVGFIIGIAAVEWLNYPVTAYIMARHKLWQPSIDMTAFALSAAAIGLALAIL